MTGLLFLNEEAGLRWNFELVRGELFHDGCDRWAIKKHIRNSTGITAVPSKIPASGWFECP